MTNNHTTKQPANTSGQPRDDRGIIDLTLMRSALHDNWDLLQQMINHLEEEAPLKVQKLEEAVADNNHKQTQETAHALKGILANFGAQRAVSLVAELEAKATAGDLTDAGATCKNLADEIKAVLVSLADALDRHGD